MTSPNLTSTFFTFSDLCSANMPGEYLHLLFPLPAKLFLQTGQCLPLHLLSPRPNVTSSVRPAMTYLRNILNDSQSSQNPLPFFPDHFYGIFTYDKMVYLFDNLSPGADSKFHGFRKLQVCWLSVDQCLVHNRSQEILVNDKTNLLIHSLIN